jgi:hypothetical protein
MNNLSIGAIASSQSASVSASSGSAGSPAYQYVVASIPVGSDKFATTYYPSFPSFSNTGGSFTRISGQLSVIDQGYGFRQNGPKIYSGNNEIIITRDRTTNAFANDWIVKTTYPMSASSTLQVCDNLPLSASIAGDYSYAQGAAYAYFKDSWFVLGVKPYNSYNDTTVYFRVGKAGSTFPTSSSTWTFQEYGISVSNVPSGSKYIAPMFNWSLDMNVVNTGSVLAYPTNISGSIVIFYTTDGISWLNSKFLPVDGGYRVSNMFFDGTRYIIHRQGNVMYTYYSTDLVSWSYQPGGPVGYVRGGGNLLSKYFSGSYISAIQKQDTETEYEISIATSYNGTYSSKGIVNPLMPASRIIIGNEKQFVWGGIQWITSSNFFTTWDANQGDLNYINQNYIGANVISNGISIVTASGVIS